MKHSISTYIAAVRQNLNGPAWHVDPIIEEIDAHLHDSVDELLAGGMDEGDAADLAISRFGTVEQVAGRFNLESPPRLTAQRRLMNLATETAMLSKAIITFAVLTMLGATINIYFSFVQIDDPARWIAVKVLASAFIIGVGVFSIAAVARRRTARPGAVLATALAIFAFGMLGGAIAVLMGETRGDFEGPIVLINMLLVGQGALVALYAWTRKSQTAQTT